MDSKKTQGAVRYFPHQFKYSRRMTTVRVIFVEMTIPFRMRPLIETLPVKGHFLSTYEPSSASLGVLKPRPTLRTYLKPFLLFFASVRLRPRNTASCFWYAFSV